MSAPGVPEGWQPEEQEDLRFGVWRFYRLVNPEGSVREDNLAVRDGVPMWGADGLKTFLEDVDPFADPTRVPAETLAAQLAHWFVRGDGRRPSRIRAPEAASSGIEEERFVVRARFDRGGVDQELTVTLARDGESSGRWS